MFGIAVWSVVNGRVEQSSGSESSELSERR